MSLECLNVTLAMGEPHAVAYEHSNLLKSAIESLSAQKWCVAMRKKNQASQCIRHT